MKFYRCKKCNKFVALFGNTNPLPCCSEEMEELDPKMVGASSEKHIPIVSYNKGYLVIVGEIEHPMTDEHYIEWIAFELENGSIKVIDLKPNEKPIAYYETQQKAKTVYAYCNLHGLWKAEIEK